MWYRVMSKNKTRSILFITFRNMMFEIFCISNEMSNKTFATHKTLFIAKSFLLLPLLFLLLFELIHIFSLELVGFFPRYCCGCLLVSTTQFNRSIVFRMSNFWMKQTFFVVIVVAVCLCVCVLVLKWERAMCTAYTSKAHHLYSTHHFVLNPYSIHFICSEKHTL